jgi:hypothetical protein
MRIDLINEQAFGEWPTWKAVKVKMKKALKYVCLLDDTRVKRPDMTNISSLRDWPWRISIVRKQIWKNSYSGRGKEELKRWYFKIRRRNWEIVSGCNIIRISLIKTGLC